MSLSAKQSNFLIVVSLISIATLLVTEHRRTHRLVPSAPAIECATNDAGTESCGTLKGLQDAQQ